MYSLIVIGIGLGAGLVRYFVFNKRKNNRKKLTYYNYRKYEIKYKRINDVISQQSKNGF